MNCNLSTTEEQIMKFLWSKNRPVKTGEIMDYFVKHEHRDWKRQTLNTLLIRLDDKEVIIRRRGIVQAIYTEDELQQQKCVNFVKENFAGNLHDDLVAYIGDKKLDEEEIISLINAIEGS